MIYFVVVPSMAGFANYISPVLIGAPDSSSSPNVAFSSFQPDVIGGSGLTDRLRAYIAGLWEADGTV